MTKEWHLHRNLQQKAKRLTLLVSVQLWTGGLTLGREGTKAMQEGQETEREQEGLKDEMPQKDQREKHEENRREKLKGQEI